MDALFRDYLRAQESCLNVAAAYMTSDWFTSQAEYDVLMAIQKLPLDVLGVKPTTEQAARMTKALAAFGEAAGIMVRHNATVVNVAENIHWGAQMTLTVAGVGGIVVSGARLAMQQGCKELLKYAAQQVANYAVATGAGFVSQQATALAERWGLNPYWVRVGAEALQVAALIRAAKTQRKMAGAGCS